MIFVNGEACEATSKTVAAYLIGSGYDVRRVAVEYNGAILPKCDYDKTELQSGDRLEIVSFVGGG